MFIAFLILGIIVSGYMLSRDRAATAYQTPLEEAAKQGKWPILFAFFLTFALSFVFPPLLIIAVPLGLYALYRKLTAKNWN